MFNEDKFQIKEIMILALTVLIDTCYKGCLLEGESNA